MPFKTQKVGRSEEDEGSKQKKKYDETLKLKRDLLKQEFDHLEEIRKYDELSVNSLNEVKFKSELDRLNNMRKQRIQTLNNLQKTLSQLNTPEEPQQTQSHFNNHSTSAFRASTNNHHSDQLYETFSRNLLARGAGDLQEHLQNLRAEQERYQQLIETEKGKSDALELNLQEITKSNINLQQEIQELRLLNRVADKRFNNIEAVQFLASEKQTISNKNLKSIKNELREMQEMRKQYRKKQQEKQREYKKEIHVGEEYVSHNGMKIEEAEMKNAELEKQIVHLEQEEQRILEKRSKSRNILDYIEAFQTFEKIFMNPEQNPTGSRLVDCFCINEELLYKESDLIIVETDENYKFKEIRSTFENSVNEYQPFDRNHLRNVIDNAFQQHDDGVQYILKFMLEKYWQLTEELMQSNQTYEVLLQQKTILNNELEDEQLILVNILEKNKYIQNEDEEKLQLQQRELIDEVNMIENVVDEREQVAYDTGLFVSNMGRKGSQTNQTTTLNIVKVELEDVVETKNLAQKNLKCQNLLFNFYLSFSALMYRSAQTLQVVSENSYNITSMDLTQLVLTISKFCEELWSKTASRKSPKMTKKPHHHLLDKRHGPHYSSAISHSTPDTEDQAGQQQDVMSYFQIDSIFKEVFMRTQGNTNSAPHSVADSQSVIQIGFQNQQLDQLVSETSKYFYIQCKQDQLIWLLLTPQLLKGFLINLQRTNLEYFKEENIKKLKLNILLPSYQIANLRQELVQYFCANFHALLNYYQQLDVKLKDLSSELKIYLKEKDPKFDPQRLDFVSIRDGSMIKEARSLIAQKMDLYKTGEVRQPKQSAPQSGLAKIFGKKQESQNEGHHGQEILLKGMAKLVTPELTIQNENFLQKIKEKLTEEELLYLKEFYHSKLHHKYEPSVQTKKNLEEKQNKQNQRSTVSEKDEFDEERDQIKDTLYTDWASIQEQNNLKNLQPQQKEQISEKKAQIKDVTERLYGERGEAAQTLKTMSVTTGILSNIDKLEKQPSSIEQPQLISNFKLQKMTMNRNLNKELSLPTLHFLKPTSAYFSRRQQSQEQLRAMAKKKYDLIESGMAPSTQSTAARPPTEAFNKRKLKTSEQSRNYQLMNANVEKFYQRYGSQEQSKEFLGYLMNRQVAAQQAIDNLTLQDFQFNQPNSGRRIQQNDFYKPSAGGARPKSILVYPQH